MNRIKGSSVEGGVPSVLGMGIREAVVKLERAGLTVQFEGSGYVKEQYPEPGSNYSKGDAAKLIFTDF